MTCPAYGPSWHSDTNPRGPSCDDDELSVSRISPAGYIQNFRTGQRINWKAAGRASALDAQDRAQMAAEAAQKRQERAAERERQCERTAQEVDAIRTTATPTQPIPIWRTRTSPRMDAAVWLCAPMTEKRCCHPHFADAHQW